VERVLLVAIIGALAAACGASPAIKKSPVADVALAPDSAELVEGVVLAPLPDRHAKLTFNVGSLAPLPFVHGTIGGVPTWMIVDSGASTQFAPSWMADRAKVHTRPTTSSVSDHVRHNMNVALADRSLIAIEGWGGLTPGELLVVDEEARGLGAKYGIGIILSPQELDDDRAVILELDRRSIRTGSEAAAVRALAARKIAVDPDDIAFCHGVFSVAAIIDGLFSLSDAGRALAPHAARSRSEGEAGSGPVALRVSKGARIQLGGLSVRKDIDILTGAPEIQCPVDGVLGIDVLRSCVLVFGNGRGRLRIKCNE